MCCGYAEPPDHVPWQNGNTVTPREGAQLAAKDPKTFPTHCTSVEVVQEKQSAALHTDHYTIASHGGQRQTPSESNSNFTGLYLPREREGRSMPFGKKVEKRLVSS